VDEGRGGFLQVREKCSDVFLVQKTSTHVMSKVLATSSKAAPVGLIALKSLLTVDQTSQKERRVTSGSKPELHLTDQKAISVGGGGVCRSDVTAVLLLLYCCTAVLLYCCTATAVLLLLADDGLLFYCCTDGKHLERFQKREVSEFTE